MHTYPQYELRVKLINLTHTSPRYQETKWLDLPQMDLEGALSDLFEEDYESDEFDYAIRTYHTSTVGLLHSLLNIDRLELINDLSHEIEALEEWQLYDLPAIADEVSTLEEAIEVAGRNLYMILEFVDTAEGLGEELVREEYFAYDIPEELERFISYKSIGQEAVDSGEWSLDLNRKQAIRIFL